MGMGPREDWEALGRCVNICAEKDIWSVAFNLCAVFQLMALLSLSSESKCCSSYWHLVLFSNSEPSLACFPLDSSIPHGAAILIFLTFPRSPLLIEYGPSS